MIFNNIKLTFFMFFITSSSHSQDLPLHIEHSLHNFSVASNTGQRLELFSINLNTFSNQSPILRVIKPRQDRSNDGHILFEFLLNGQSSGPNAPMLQFHYSEQQALQLASLWQQKPVEYNQALLLLKENLSNLQMKFLQFKMQRDRNEHTSNEDLIQQIYNLESLENAFHRQVCKITKIRIAKFYLPSERSHEVQHEAFTPQAWSSLVSQYKNLEWIRYTLNQLQESVRRAEARLLPPPSGFTEHVQEQLQRNHFHRSLSGNNLASYEINQNEVEVEEIDMHCSICNENEWFTLPCGHRFHSGCLAELLLYQNKCPLCRDLIPLRNLRQQNSHG
ncbi:MAG: RING finger protein [Oligoflexales bacterium]